ncbi:hypothetical protein PQ459_05455 [Chryseobacterium sp. KACC 21268]|nr:hypothetical protein PQ459_05455 [Chryseobacterium sp. KACC 21268]
MTDKERKIFNYGILVGELGVISRFNDKTDHIYNFSLKLLPKLKTIDDIMENIYIDVSAGYKLTEVEEQNSFKFFCDLLYDKWFYPYQDKDQYHLSDIGNNFSLYFKDWKREFVVDFVNLLLEALNPIKIYEIQYHNLKSYYASDYNEFLLECVGEVYHFKLLVSD